MATDRDFATRDLESVLAAENALHQAIFLCDHLAAKESRDHPSGPDFVTHYVIPHGLWANVLRERQNLRHAIQTAVWGHTSDG